MILGSARHFVCVDFSIKPKSTRARKRDQTLSYVLNVCQISDNSFRERVTNIHPVSQKYALLNIQ